MVLSCAHEPYMSLDMSEKCQLVPVTIPSLFEQNVLKAVSRTQLDRSCKVYAGKVESCTLASKKWGALEALFGDDSYLSSFCLFQSQLSHNIKKTRNKHVQIETRVDPSRKMVFDLAFALNINQD